MGEVTVSPVFTIGHSTLGTADFLDLLTRHRINAIADVRSSPYSRFNPQFNRESLKSDLAAAGIRYVFLGAELGARSDDPGCYVNGKVQYRLIAETPLFKSGLERIVEGSRAHRISLMCAEKEPLDCHRTILVSRELVALGIDVQHILSDGSIELHAHAIGRLMDVLGLPPQDMFRSSEETLGDAYAMQERKIAYDHNTHATKIGDRGEHQG